MEVLSKDIWWAFGINGLAAAGANTLGGIGGDILKRN
jgi:hypothetical protein